MSKSKSFPGGVEDGSISFDIFSATSAQPSRYLSRHRDGRKRRQFLPGTLLPQFEELMPTGVFCFGGNRVDDVLGIAIAVVLVFFQFEKSQVYSRRVGNVNAVYQSRRVKMSTVEWGDLEQKQSYAVKTPVCGASDLEQKQRYEMKTPVSGKECSCTKASTFKFGAIFWKSLIGLFIVARSFLIFHITNKSLSHFFCKSKNTLT